MSIGISAAISWVVPGCSKHIYLDVPAMHPMPRNNRRLKAMPQVSIMPPSVEPLRGFGIKSWGNRCWYFALKSDFHEFPIQNEMLHTTSMLQTKIHSQRSLQSSSSTLRCLTTCCALNLLGFCRFLSLKRNIWIYPTPRPRRAVTTRIPTSTSPRLETGVNSIKSQGPKISWRKTTGSHQACLVDCLRIILLVVGSIFWIKVKLARTIGENWNKHE